MTETLPLALQITLIGISLVLGSIALLGIFMSLLVRLTADRAPAEAEAVSAAREDERELRQRAAIAAVAVALAREAESQRRASPLPPTAIVSAWQAVMRGRQLKQRGPIR